MYKIIGADRKEYGPVTTDQINTWILEGRANDETLVQAQGSTEWKPLSSCPEFAGVLAAKGASAAPSWMLPGTLRCPPGRSEFT